MAGLTSSPEELDSFCPLCQTLFLLNISFVIFQDNEAKIHFDDESHIRVLHPDKFKHTEELAEQCTSFVESKTLVFVRLIFLPNTWLETMPHILCHSRSFKS